MRIHHVALPTCWLLVAGWSTGCSGELKGAGGEQETDLTAESDSQGAPGVDDAGSSDPNEPSAPGSTDDEPGNPGDGSESGGGDTDALSPSPELGDDSGPGALPEGTDPGGVSVECAMTEPGVSPLMKLSTLQYQNTVRDLLARSGMDALLSDVEPALARIPDDSLGDSFRGMDNRVSLEHVQGYLDVGVAVGDALLRNPSLLEELAGSCALDEDLTDACAEDFLSRFLRLAYRRAVTESDLSEYLELNDGTRSAAEAIRAMVIVALSSPRFVHHLEIDGTASSSSADILHLSSYEIASRLSYTFWQTMPDEELLEAADDGELATEAGFEEQLARVFDDPRSHHTLWQFWSEWMRLEKFTGFETARPAFQSLAEGTAIGQEGHDYYGDMVQEVRELTELLTFGRTATVADLLTSDVSVTRSEDLAELYGVEPYSGSGEYQRFPEGTRVGLFQRAALLVSNLEQTNPFHRGALVRRAVLCDALPQPDPNALPPGSLDPPPLNEAQTTRQRFEAKVADNTLCEGCHAAFSDIGYVLESFDALGRYRTVETVYDEQTGELLAELPIDSSAVARVDLTDDTLVEGPIDLAQRMVDSGKVESCLAQSYFRFATRRELETSSADACVASDLSELLADPEQGLRGAFRRIAQYDSFFQRKVGPR